MDTTQKEYDSTRYMRAKFDGTCYNCKQSFSQGDSIKYNWAFKKAYHLTCEETNSRHETPVQHPEKIIPFGHYIVVVEDAHFGAKGKVVLRVHQPKRGAFAGQTMLQRHKEHGNFEDEVAWRNVAFYNDGHIGIFARLRSDALLCASLKTLVESDYEACGKSFALETGHCRRCGRLLTSEETAQQFEGYGAHCHSVVFGPQKKQSGVYIWVS